MPLEYLELKEKLSALRDGKGITSRLRSYLRHIILNEFQSETAHRPLPVITIRDRALGSLVVEWLQQHECHYTLSLLASEVPSLSDLPALSDNKKNTNCRISVRNNKANRFRIHAELRELYIRTSCTKE